MEKTTRNNDTLKFSIEVILQVFKSVNKKIDELKKIGDISAIEILERDVIPKYEKLYGGLTGEEIKKFDEEQLAAIKKYIKDIMKENNFNEEYIKKQMELREKLKGDSGAEVVKRFFQYEKKELEKTKYELLDRADKILEEEEKLSMEMKNAVQEEEQIEYIYKLQPVRAEFRKIEEKMLKIQEKLNVLNKRLTSEWPYEIYGTLSKDEMLKTYNKIMKK
ncbi:MULTISPECIES: hypothetical protein [Fusobacterium]|uniref:Uncharacterized protein n=2 Tax=Fusobacterium varium TaxID=856 RepID=A0ABM6U146_FUSVA|nr:MULTISPECIES: hypothetical protein [Fusobacterium]AVQ29918.1 hypothetical protein C4N18_01255 [Fusobacterium varium ATCC 27725]EES65207.2 hypothetical protein FVAG_02187 [Fusobacterium varium ATCC 27725]MCF0170653.1 hypothetical protein [Fusobacterium varium]MCF2672946.1 hypothetical protein [Fusobacterium varium]MCI6031941.1 hypothetical protein [Fusobacterium varium]